MSLNRSSKAGAFASWVLFALLVSVVTFTVYDRGWAATTKEPRPYTVRLELIGLVILLALSGNLFLRIFRPVYRLPVVRGFLIGIFVAAVVCSVGGFYSDRYLGGNGIGRSDDSGFYLLMYEGWGMMFIPLCTIFGLFVLLREAFEKPSDKTKEAA